MKHFTKIYILIFILLIFSCSNVTMKKYSSPNEGWFFGVDTLEMIDQTYGSVLLKKEYGTLKNKQFGGWNKKNNFRKSSSSWGITHFGKKRIFGENKKIHDSLFLSSIEKNLNLEKFPSINKNGITVEYCDIKILPTIKPIYYDFNDAGEGYPFDNNQNSSLWPNMPLKVIHESTDGRWLYVSTPITLGWVEKNKVCFINNKTKKEFTKYDLIALNNDNISIIDRDGNYLHQGMVGSLYPINDSGYILAIKATTERSSKIVECKLDRADYNILPYKFTNDAMKELMKKMIGTKYGWGGAFENRDCSSSLRDMYLSFGVMLPRSSRLQKTAGTYISFDSLTVSERINLIKTKAIPYRTLVYKKGHIMMYIGSDKNRSYIFHNVWGIRTEDDENNYGRIEIGKSVISDIELGKDVQFVKKSLLEKLTGMTILF